MTVREIIDSFRSKIKERSIDTIYTNGQLFQFLKEQFEWIMAREASAGRVWTSTYMFQVIRGLEVIEVSKIDGTCPIKNCCKIYRTKDKLPPIWRDKSGTIIRLVTSIDGSTSFFVTSSWAYSNKKNDPYKKFSSEKYVFYQDGYLWFPEHNPNRINVDAFFEEDLSYINSKRNDCEGCFEKEDCVRYMDTDMRLPDWVLAESISKAAELLLGTAGRLQQDNNIDKNDTRRN
jgi:hypothetical protein